MAATPRSDKRSGGRRPRAVRAVARAEMKPLPWPPAELTPRQARKPHAHRCVECAAEFRCPGPDQAGFCVPACPPCYWVELGQQLRIYRSVVASLSRRRSKIERRVGNAACRRAQRRRRSSRRLRLVPALGASASVETGNELSGGDGFADLIERAVATVI